jgi:hypothetical protein
MRPVYPQPGFVEADLHALLATRQFAYADCVTVTPLVGPPMRYTTTQRNVSVVPVAEVSRQTYYADQVHFSGLRTKTGIGVEVDEQNLDITYGPGDLWQSHLSYPEALRLGRADGASIRRDRYFTAKLEGVNTQWVAGVPMFTGKVSTCSRVGRMSATINVKSDLVLLNVQMPRDLFIPQCKNTWGDGAGCDLVQDDFALQGTTLTGTTRAIIQATGYDDTFSQGKLHIEASDSVTRIRTILRATSSELELILPLDFLPADGTIFVAFPNCRRLFANCGLYHTVPEEKFIGFPFIPVVETAA